MSTLPSVTIVVLNWQNERDTAECLDSLLAQTGVEAQILLVDNASADGSGAALHARYPTLPYLQTGANLGYAGGNNRGIEWALDRGAEWILVLNNDTIAEPDCLARLLAAAIAAPRIAAFAPTIVRHDDPSRAWFAGGSRSDLKAMGVHHLDMTRANAGERSAMPCTFLSGCCVLFRAEALRAVGLFREDLFAYAEDFDLSRRLERAGWGLGWVPAARLRHKVPPEGTPDSPWQMMMRDRNRRRIVRRDYALLPALAFWSWFLPTRAVHLVRFLLRGDVARARAIVDGLTAR